MSSTTLSTTGTATSSATSATTTANCGATLYDIPVQDASCAIAYGGNHTSMMSNCCGAADVVSYADNCGLYCLAEGQTVSELTTCLYDNGASYSDVFCRGTGNATASETAADATSLASGASVVASASGSTASGSATGTASGSGSSSTSGASKGAAAGGTGLTLGGVTASAVLLSSLLLGAMQL